MVENPKVPMEVEDFDLDFWNLNQRNLWRKGQIIIKSGVILDLLLLAVHSSEMRGLCLIKIFQLNASKFAKLLEYEHLGAYMKLGFLPGGALSAF